MIDKRQIAFLVVKYGLYTVGILLLICSLIQYLGAPFSLFFNLLLVILGSEMFFCCSEYKRRYGPKLSYKEAFTLGWQVAFIAGLINASLVFIIVKLTSVEALNTILVVYKRALLTTTGESEETVEQILGLIVNPWFLFFYFNIVYIVLGLFISLIIAFWAKTNEYPTVNE